MPHVNIEVRRAYQREFMRRHRANMRAAKDAEIVARRAGRNSLNPIDLAWCAGYFEGEGTATLSQATAKGRPYLRPIISVTSCDVESIQFFHSAWRGNLRIHQPKGNAREAFTWRLSSREKVHDFCSDVLPYVKRQAVRDKLALLLEFIDTAKSDTRDAASLLTIRRLNHRGALPAIAHSYDTGKPLMLEHRH